MTERESLQLIAQMLHNTRQRYHLNDGKIYMIWGYTSVAVTLLVWISLWMTHNPWCNFLWFCIPLFGAVLQARLVSKTSDEPYVKTYTDRMLTKLWKAVGMLAWIFTAICGCFHYFGNAQAWVLMMLYGILITGFAMFVNGLVIEERSLYLGGFVGIVSGAIVACAAFVGIPLLDVWVLPLFMLSFIAMFIVPGHIIHAKAQREQLSNS